MLLNCLLHQFSTILIFFQWRASLKLGLYVHFRSLSWTLNSNSPLNFKKKIYNKSKLLSFVQCFEKAILLKLIYEWPSKRFVLLSGHFWTNQNSTFDLGPVCHVINCLVSLHWGLWWLATCIQPVWNAVVNTCILSTGCWWEIQILEFHTLYYFNFVIFIPKNSRKLIKLLKRSSTEEWINYSKLFDIESLNRK